MSEEDKGGLRRDVEEFDRKKEERGGRQKEKRKWKTRKEGN